MNSKHNKEYRRRPNHELVEEQLDCGRISMKGGTTNSEFANQDEKFLEACITADVKPTRRQASKFRNKSGKAYRKMKESTI